MSQDDNNNESKFGSKFRQKVATGAIVAASLFGAGCHDGKTTESTKEDTLKEILAKQRATDSLEFTHRLKPFEGSNTVLPDGTPKFIAGEIIEVNAGGSFHGMMSDIPPEARRDTDKNGRITEVDHYNRDGYIAIKDAATGKVFTLGINNLTETYTTTHWKKGADEANATVELDKQLNHKKGAFVEVQLGQDSALAKGTLTQHTATNVINAVNKDEAARRSQEFKTARDKELASRGVDVATYYNDSTKSAIR